jgi:HEAT repeat protein
MKRLLVLVVGCLVIGFAGLSGVVFGQKQKDIPVPTRAEIPALVKELKSDDAGKRTRAAQLLGRAGQVNVKLVSAAVPTLLDMAQKDGDTGARRAAAEALGYSAPEPKDAVPILVSILKDDKDLGVKTAAATALGYLGPSARDAVPALQEALAIGKNAAKDEKDKQALGKAAGAALKLIGGKAK